MALPDKDFRGWDIGGFVLTFGVYSAFLGFYNSDGFFWGVGLNQEIPLNMFMRGSDSFLVSI